MSARPKKKATFYLGFEVVDRVWGRSDLSEDKAMDLAVSEIHAMRDEKRGARGS